MVWRGSCEIWNCPLSVYVHSSQIIVFGVMCIAHRWARKITNTKHFVFSSCFVVREKLWSVLELSTLILLGRNRKMCTLSPAKTIQVFIFYHKIIISRCLDILNCWFDVFSHIPNIMICSLMPFIWDIIACNLDFGWYLAKIHVTVFQARSN